MPENGEWISGAVIRRLADMKKRCCTSFPAAAAAGVLAAGIGNFPCIFYTYVAVRAGFPIEMDDRTEITETFSNWVKSMCVLPMNRFRTRCISGRKLSAACV